MLKPTISNHEISDEEIYSGLETMLDYFCEQIPRYKSMYSDDAFEETRWDLQRRPLFREHVRKLQAAGYDEWTAKEFLFAGYALLFKAEAVKKMQDLGPKYNQQTAATLF